MKKLVLFSVITLGTMFMFGCNTPTTESQETIVDTTTVEMTDTTQKPVIVDTTTKTANGVTTKK